MEPIDDFRPTNPPSNPPLLEWLTDDFIAQGYDLRHLVRTIVLSRAYQLSSEPNEANADDEANFARATVKRIAAEKLLDAQCASPRRSGRILRLSCRHAGGSIGGRAPGEATARSGARRRPVIGDVRQARTPPRVRVRALERNDAQPGVSLPQRRRPQRARRGARRQARTLSRAPTDRTKRSSTNSFGPRSRGRRPTRSCTRCATLRGERRPPCRCARLGLGADERQRVRVPALARSWAATRRGVHVRALLLISTPVIA